MNGTGPVTDWGRPEGAGPIIGPGRAGLLDAGLEGGMGNGATAPMPMSPPPLVITVRPKHHTLG